MDSSIYQFLTLVGNWPYFLLSAAAISVVLKSSLQNSPPQTLIAMLLCLFAVHYLPLYVGGLQLMVATASAQANASLQGMLDDARPVLSVLPTLFELLVLGANSLALYRARSKPNVDV